ncbi:MAG: hypothetical protein HDQ88_11820 [Clostridia bacterium]|nr:hypothetical protein [Clostridia bacterium]
MTRPEMIQWLDEHTKTYVPPNGSIERYRYSSLIFRPTPEYGLTTNEDIYAICADRHRLSTRYVRYRDKLTLEFQRKHPKYYLGIHGSFDHWLLLEKENRLEKPLLHNAAHAPENLTDQELRDRVALVTDMDDVARKLRSKLLILLSLK